MKPVGKPDAGNPHVRFDERGGETDRSRDTAPLLDFTVEKKAANAAVLSVDPLVRGGSVAAATLSCVFVSKSLASCRSCNWPDGSPCSRLTIRPRLTAGRAWIGSAQRTTFLYSYRQGTRPRRTG